jgi:DNA-binding GntR family transcriptional regulator
MSIPSFPTITEQVASYLREELLRGRWSGEIAGQKKLAKLLGVSGQTVELALGLLEKDGILVGQGTGRRRRILLPEDHS